MKVTELKKGYHMFGNRGNVWTNSAHIAESGFNSTTMCGVPMLSTNWARLEKLEEIGCKRCIELYKEKTKS